MRDLFSHPGCWVIDLVAMTKQQPHIRKGSYVAKERASNYPQGGWGAGSTF